MFKKWCAFFLLCFSFEALAMIQTIRRQQEPTYFTLLPGDLSLGIEEKRVWATVLARSSFLSQDKAIDQLARELELNPTLIQNSEFIYALIDKIFYNGVEIEKLQALADKFRCPGALQWLKDYELIYAIRMGYLDIRKLIMAGANVNALIQGNRPLVEIARFPGRICEFKFLLEQGADFTLTEICGDTALHNAVAGCNSEAVKILLALKASVTVLNNSGRTPLEDFVFGGRKAALQQPFETTLSALLEILDLLLSAGADINPIASYGITPLRQARESINEKQDTEEGQLRHQAVFKAIAEFLEARGAVI